MFFVLFYDIKWENFKCVINMKKYRFIYKFKFFGIFIDMTQLNKICSTHFDNVCTAGILLCQKEILFLQQRLFARQTHSFLCLHASWIESKAVL